MSKVFHSIYVVKRCSPDGWKPVAAFFDLAEAISFVDKKIECGASIGDYIPFQSELSIPFYI